MTAYEIPLSAVPQTMLLSIGGIDYRITVRWNDALGAWLMDLAAGSGASILLGVPLVTGCDLLEQYRHLNIGGSLYVQSDSDLMAMPTADNLGSTSHLYFVVP
jgi:hypothetical protein